MNVIEAIRGRHTVREFRPESIAREVIEHIVAAAHEAPSSWNLQPWEYIVVTDPGLKQALREAAGGQAQIEQAGAVFVVLGSLRQQDALADRIAATIPPDGAPGRRERMQNFVTRARTDEAFRHAHVETNTYIGAAYLTLAAMEFGLSTCWVGSFSPEKVREIFAIPAEYLVVSLVAMGYPARDPAELPRHRRPVAEILHWNGL